MPSTLRKFRSREELEARYAAVRSQTERLCAPLADEDYQLQSMPDCSPPKWHLAHTTWFFETFVLADHSPEFRPFDPQYNFLFNSYYDAIGDRLPRASRGLLSRPTVSHVRAYRCAVDERIRTLIVEADEPSLERIAPILELGLNHEQQHQELLLTDLKHAFALNPLRPGYAPPQDRKSDSTSTPSIWERVPEGLYEIGHAGSDFAFDNEEPLHKVYLNGFEIASRLVTVGDFLDFIDDGGYHRPEHWLSDGWAAKRRNDWTAPLYWEGENRSRSQFTLRGMRALDLGEPICHLSYYEADAYARWAGARLPAEAEWEVVARKKDLSGNFLDSGLLHPARCDAALFGNVWVWTASPYIAYPGYRPAAGAIGEYNGKFMCNQMVLRGGSCVTPESHVRSTYRNFFPPDARWQFSGLRLAKDASE